MTRAALIIIVPGKEDDPHGLPNIVHDATGFKEYLMSDIGGAWTEKEIRVIRNPTENEILLAKFRLMLVDYAFVVFSGHGFTNIADGKVYLVIQGKEIPEDDLVCSQKQTIIVDACRSYDIKVATLINLSESKKIASTKIPDARTLFDKAIQRAEPDCPIFLHAASAGKPCSVGIDGSFYIQSLLKAGMAFGGIMDSHHRVLDVAEAHSEAKHVLKRDYPIATQNATITGSLKRRNWFPFAICQPSAT